MSYDISILNEPCPACGHVDNFAWDGLTYNLREMFCFAFEHKDGMKSLDGKKASEVAPILERALDHMKHFPEQYRRFDSPNGWGKFDGDSEETSIPFLIERFLEACKRMPNGVVRIQ